MSDRVLRGIVPSAVAFPIEWSAGPAQSKYSIEDGYAFECRVGGIVHVGHTLAEAIGKSLGDLRDTAWPEIRRRADEAEAEGKERAEESERRSRLTVVP